MALGPRLLATARDPWAALVSAFGGGTAWAVGLPGPVAIGTAGVMFGAAAVVNAVTGRPEETAEKLPELKPATTQARLIDSLDAHLRSIRGLRSSSLPSAVDSAAVEALTAGDGARRSAIRVAVAVDAMDEAVRVAEGVKGETADAALSIWQTVERLRQRRTSLLNRLTTAVDEVAKVYAGLLELSATARTLDVTFGDDTSGVTAVNRSLTALQQVFDELEADAAKLRE